MKRMVTSILATAAMLALLAAGSTAAQKSGKHSGARSHYSGGAQFTLGDGSVRSTRPGAKRLRQRGSGSQKVRRKGPKLMEPSASGHIE